MHITAPPNVIRARTLSRAQPERDARPSVGAVRWCARSTGRVCVCVSVSRRALAARVPRTRHGTEEKQQALASSELLRSSCERASRARLCRCLLSIRFRCPLQCLRASSRSVHFAEQTTDESNTQCTAIANFPAVSFYILNEANVRFILI